MFFRRVKVLENHYFPTKHIEYGRIWISLFRIDLGLIEFEIKVPTWNRWTKTKYLDIGKIKNGDKKK